MKAKIIRFFNLLDRKLLDKRPLLGFILNTFYGHIQAEFWCTKNIKKYFTSFLLNIYI